MDLTDWAARQRAAGQDSHGAFELPLGIAVIIGYLLLALLGKAPWWAVLVFLLLGVVGLGFGHRAEARQLKTLGRRRVRGTLLLGATWLLGLWSFFWVCVLLLFARARAWDRMPGWHEGVMGVSLLLGIYSLAFGIKKSLRRQQFTGIALIIWAVVLPAVGVFRERAYLASAVFLGLVLVVSGALGQRSLRRHLASRQP